MKLKVGQRVFLRAMSNERVSRALPYGWHGEIAAFDEVRLKLIPDVNAEEQPPLVIEFTRLLDDEFHYGGQEYRLERMVQ